MEDIKLGNRGAYIWTPAPGKAPNTNKFALLENISLEDKRPALQLSGLVYLLFLLIVF